MKNSKPARLLFVALLFAAAGQAGPIVFSGGGAAPGDIQGTVDAFRSALGTLNANVAGSFGSGRREINWDGVPDGFSAPNNLPNNFFNSNSPRGVVFSTPGSAVQVSADNDNPTATPVEFGNIDPGYTALFQTFSAQRLFTAIGSNVTDVNFFVPGTGIASFTSAFGVVFTGVNEASSTSVQFFDLGGTPLGTFFASAGGLSFVGVQFDAGERIGRVRITSGNAALGAGVIDVPGQRDVVVMDDFIYAEPAAIPEPGTWVMLSAGVALLALRRRARTRR